MPRSQFEEFCVKYVQKYPGCIKGNVLDALVRITKNPLKSGTYYRLRSHLLNLIKEGRIIEDEKRRLYPVLNNP